jgi:hypothetical protein
MSLPLARVSIGALLALVLACRGRPEPALEPLIGRWTTSDPLYAERSFEITPARELVIGIGPEQADRCPIVAVEGEARDAERQSYSLVYVDGEGERCVVDLEYVAPRRSIRLRSRPDVLWTREEQP